MPSAAKSAQNGHLMKLCDMIWHATKPVEDTIRKTCRPFRPGTTERLDRERNISAASTWTNREVAEETVAQALRAEHDKIARWEDEVTAARTWRYTLMLAA